MVMNRFCLLFSALLFCTVVSSCYRDPQVQPELPVISIDKSSLQKFSYEAGASQEVLLTVNREWSIECDADWLAFDYDDTPVEAGVMTTIPVSITALTNPVGNTRSTYVRFKTSAVYADLFVEQDMNAELPPTVVYYNGFGADLGGKDNPLVGDTDVWRAEEGVATEVKYYQYDTSTDADYVSVRNSDTSNSIDNMTPCYVGASGNNHIFFGKGGGPAFTVAEIDVHPKLSMLEVSFGVFNIDNVPLDKNKFKLFVSKDGEKWVALDYKVLSEYEEPKWNLCEAEFYFEEDSFEKLHVMLDAELESKFRMDDLKVSSDLEAEAKEHIDWSSGVAKPIGDIID